MRKRKLQIVFIILLLVILVKYIQMPDFIIYGGMSNQFGDVRISKINVVVYKAHFNPKLPKIIANDFCHMNGTPDELHINMYFSKWSIKRGVSPYKTVVFKRD